MKCQTTFGNTVQIPVTILLRETSWTVVPHPHLPLSLALCTIYTSSLPLFLSRLLQFKKFPIGTACCIRFERKFFMGAEEKKSVQTSSQLASSCWSQEKREGDRQTVTTTTLATENKSIQLIVCADVKVCVCECKSLINTIFYNCSVIVCVCASVSVSVDWMQHWKNNRNWEKIQQKKKKRNTAATTTTYNVRQLQCRFAIEVSIYFAG